MASSTTSQGGYSRPRQNARRQPISRTSTLFGTIRNIVTAPLSWFASTDDFEDTRDNMGKRRRLAAVPTEPALDEEDMAPRTKRMRVESPPRGLRREGAYLDPPPAVFQQPPSIGRSISTGTQTAHYHLAATETTGNYSREGGAFQSQRPLSVQRDVDSSMESVHAPLPLPASFHRTSHSMPRDLSVPHSRPPFRMRTSLTPQPAQIQRERSEPPPLQLLRTHPTFVKPPPLEEDARADSAEAAATLGSLVDSVRRHGSLLFGGKAQPEPKSEMTRAQKALHELDIYKTPLLPTRLRGAQASITGVPDLFKPRRNKLVLIKDEKRKSDRKLGRKEEVSPDKSKPYAGEGGMKKMLAKRKLELEEEEEEEELGTPSGKAGRVEEKERDETMEEEKVEPQPSIPAEVIPPPPKDDWYSLASGPSAGTGGSSLRVGRAKLSRNHISRPTARTKAKFSAAFDDEDEAMQDNDKEREMLEEAAKKVPAFNIPAGFSFAQDVSCRHQSHIVHWFTCL
ncbi:hypothetical protein P691DRAFT_147756 [Macrolepiota fuliginosa MF-IS2]|uniref:Uncharacterized protein n=1 Tax=Macrolepiota fuliginosa MF-IS2 TaxID=1400762 RepID=A0A9P5XL27_9AGAR|nr:hypothetical protein P691DRAFT_147756 [Macrolepiota fuliginosa MF-IS2]